MKGNCLKAKIFIFNELQRKYHKTQRIVLNFRSCFVSNIFRFIYSFKLQFGTFKTWDINFRILAWIFVLSWNMSQNCNDDLWMISSFFSFSRRHQVFLLLNFSPKMPFYSPSQKYTRLFLKLNILYWSLNKSK